MIYLRLRAFVILWFVAISLGGYLARAQTEENQMDKKLSEEILIFRTSPGIELNAEGLFRFQVSAFSPILVVKVNGFAQMVTSDADWAEFEIPFYLEKGKNLFKVFVQTEKGQIEKEFIVMFEPRGEKKKPSPPLKGVVVIGQTNSDNVLNVSDGNSKKSSAKNDFLLSIGYSYGLNEESNVSFNAVLKFDHFQDRSLVTEEVLFRQFSFDYGHSNLLGIAFDGGIGQNVISLKNMNSSDPHKAGEFVKDAQSFFVFLSGTKKWGSFSGSFKMQLDSQDKLNTDAEDGTLSLSSLGAKMRWEKFRLNARLDSKSTTFKETYKDYESTIIDTGMTFSWTPWIFGLGFNNFDQKYKEPDPSSNIVLKIKKDELSLDAKYAYSGSTILGTSLKQIKQASSDALRSFSENQISFQYIWMF